MNCPGCCLEAVKAGQVVPILGVLVGNQLVPLCLEPATGDRGVGQSVGVLVLVEAVTHVVRVAHLVEALAIRVVWADRDQGAGAIRFGWWLDPQVVGIRSGSGARQFAETSAVLVTPVALGGTAVDAALVDVGVQVGRGAGLGRATGLESE